MLALSTGNASLYHVQTWTFRDSGILAANTYLLCWGLPLCAATVEVSTDTSGTLADGSLILGLDFDDPAAVALFATSKATRRGTAWLYDATDRVELWRTAVDLAWAEDPAELAAT